MEVREFSTRIDGKPAGNYRMTITCHEDGSVSMAVRAEIKVTKLGLTVYHYSYSGMEVWKDGYLQRLQSTTDDDGKKYTVTAAAQRDGLRIRVNGEERTVRSDVWLTSYWRLPGAGQRKGAIALLDADTAQLIDGTIQYLGAAPLTVAGGVQNCVRYRVTGKVAVDLWFDAQERLVREEWVEDGHRILLELVSLRN
jgi:hypothetical protein